MRRPEFTRASGFKSYVYGFAFALLLTALSFGLGTTRLAPPNIVMDMVYAAAVIQILVHLRYFLHLNLSYSKQALFIISLFTFVIVVLMAGGTLWIIFSLDAHMK